MKDILPELNGKDYIQDLAADYDIHFCQEDEVDELIDFIHKHWRANHIFVLSRALLDWQHHDAQNKRYNFVMARHRASGEIHSILGFIPTNQFDPSIEAIQIWPCIWKSREDISVKGLGASLYYYLKTHIKIETIAALGNTEVALGIYKHWKFSTGKIEQYYLPNTCATEILSSHMKKIPLVDGSDEGWEIKPLTLDRYKMVDSQHKIFRCISKYKSKAYYINRYFNHPIYKYLFYAIMKNHSIESILVMRECGNGSSNCLRIVDYLGDLDNLCHIKYDLQQLMLKHNYEYIDFVVIGIVPGTLEKAGFVYRKDTPDTIIPNYFEPFQKENVDLDYAFKSVDPKAEVLFYKADADQDRPNLLP